MEDRLKQRLVGASVVIGLAVIFIPELLKDSETPDKPVANIEIPPRPTPTIVEPDETVSLPLVTDPGTESTTALDDQTDIMPSPSHDTTVQPKPRQTTELSDAEMPGASDEPRFNAPDNSATAQTSIPDRQSSARATQPNAATAAGSSRRSNPTSVTRVAPNVEQLPPGITRPQLALPTDQAPDAEVTATEPATPSVDLPPVELIGRLGKDTATSTVASVETTTETATLDPINTWVVQAGSFSQQANATDLRDQLIEQGFDAFVESTNAQGQTLYRVQIGPQSSRGQGEIILTRLRALGFEGQIVSLDN